MGINNIQSVRYDESNNVLTVVFNGGSIIDYHPVNPEIYASILAGDCLYRAVHKVIRSGQIAGTKRKVSN